MKRSLYILLILTLQSCGSKDYKKFTITDFSKKRVDTLIPYKWKKKSPFHSYVMYNIKVKGYVNDTIKIKHNGWLDINLVGKIDTLIQTDYYGTNKKVVVFDPYRATRGKVDIEYSL